MKKDNRRFNTRSKSKPKRKIIKLCSIYQMMASMLLIVLFFAFLRIPNLNITYGDSIKSQLSKDYDIVKIYENAISEVKSVNFNIN